jgi:choline dehydrogenase
MWLILQGHNLMDNYETPLQIRAEEPWLVGGPSPCTGTFDDNDPCFVEWREAATGPYVITQNSDGYGGAWRSSQSWDEDCDILLLSRAGAGGGPAGFFPGYSNSSVIPNEWLHALVKMQTSNTAGTVTLNSSDPRVAPNINFNYFAESRDRDLDALVEGIEMVLSAFDAVGIPYEVLYNHRQDLRQGVLDSAFSHHASSTCRMGPADNKDSCVDPRFRVQGVDKLRVVDASVFPRSPGAMPNGPTYTISRKAYEVILEDNEKGCRVGSVE